MLGMIDQRNLIFPDAPNARYDFERMIVVFFGKEGEKSVRCAISSEALNDHYKSKSKDPIKIFLENHSAIEHEAVRKYLANRLEADGSILIKTIDL